MVYTLGKSTLTISYKVIVNPRNSRYSFVIALTINGIEQIIEGAVEPYATIHEADSAGKERVKQLEDEGFTKVGGDK